LIADQNAKIHIALFLITLLALGSIAARIQARTEIHNPSSAKGPQAGDSGFNASVASPAYIKSHPKVLFDEAHNNVYTSLGNYKSFADLITNDGYRVVPNKDKLSRKVLSGYDLLVIVNAVGPPEHRDSSPFTEEECNALRDWVTSGGSLLLIADNAPYSGAAGELSKRFGVSLTNGYTVDTSKFNREAGDQTELIFTRSDGLLADHPITTGRDTNERINRILTFSGTSMKGPPGSVALLKLSGTALDVLPPYRAPTPENPSPDHRTVSAAGGAQGLALEIGKGRVVVLGEAAMLTAQVMPSGLRFGMNISGADNRQLALNIVHWLSRLLK